MTMGEGDDDKPGNLNDGDQMKNVEEGHEFLAQNANNNENGITINNRRKGSRCLPLRKFWLQTSTCRKWLFLIILLLIIIVGVIFGLYFTKENQLKANTNNELIPPNTEVPLPPSASTLHIFKNGAVCSDSEICSKIGRDIFKRNGTVMDATLATAFCNGFTNMQSMGIGGGFIMNIYIRRNKRAYTLDAREIAAGAATEGMHLHDPRTTNEGPLSIAIPGELLGYWEGHKRFGHLPWKDIIQPSIDLCYSGFIMTKHMEDSLSFNPIIKNDPQLREMFVNQTTGNFYRQGTLVKANKRLCETLTRIAESGGDDLYNGTLRDLLAEDLKELGSIITKRDLETYKVRWSQSIPIKINDDSLHIIPPPGSGILLGFLLNILKGYNFTPENMSSINETILTYHRIVEAYKYTYGKRTEIGDPEFINIDNLMKNLTSSDYASDIRRKINDFKTMDDAKDYGAQFYAGKDEGTAHISVLAPNGDAISLTSSVNFYFGSGLAGPRTGIILNSGMDDFSTPGLKNYFGLPGSPPNFIKPHKRALSSMAPTILTDKNGDVKLVIGAAGGTKITTAVGMAIMRTIWFGQNIKEAIDAPRFHNQLIPMEIQYEFGNLDQVIKGLENLGHKTRRYRERGSIICAIYKNATGIYGNADYRKKGEVVGL